MITLYGGCPSFCLPEVSPYVTKAEVQLKMAGLSYTKQRAQPSASPKGQIPFIDDDGERIDLPHAQPDGVDIDTGTVDPFEQRLRHGRTDGVHRAAEENAGRKGAHCARVTP